MKKFIKAMQEFKKIPKDHQPKVVVYWTEKNLFYEKLNYVVTTFFSNKHIESRGMEVVYG